MTLKSYSYVKAGSKADLSVYGFIGEFEEVSAYSLTNALNEIGPVEELVIHLSSFGGQTEQGVAMHSILRSRVRTGMIGRIVVEIEGAAMSAASVLAMAGDEIRIASGALMMLHGPRIGNFGNAEEMRKRADYLDKVQSSVLNIYLEKPGMRLSKTDLEAILSSEVFYTAEEAIEAGLADTIMSRNAEDVEAAIAAAGRMLKDSVSGSQSKATVATFLAHLPTASDLARSRTSASVAPAAEVSPEPVAIEDAAPVLELEADAAAATEDTPAPAVEGVEAPKAEDTAQDATEASTEAVEDAAPAPVVDPTPAVEAEPALLAEPAPVVEPAAAPVQEQDSLKTSSARVLSACPIAVAEAVKEAGEPEDLAVSFLKSNLSLDDVKGRLKIISENRTLLTRASTASPSFSPIFEKQKSTVLNCATVNDARAMILDLMSSNQVEINTTPQASPKTKSALEDKEAAARAYKQRYGILA